MLDPHYHYFLVEVLMGESITLTCPLANNPTFSIRRASCNNEAAELITNNSTGYEVNGRELTIPRARREDEGAYFCSVSGQPFLVSCVYVSGKWIFTYSQQCTVLYM